MLAGAGCPSGQWEDKNATTDPANPVCKPCTDAQSGGKAITNCATCSNGTSCDTCDGGFFLKTTPNMDNNTNTTNPNDFACDSCATTMAGCLMCNSSSVCTKCTDGFFWDMAKNDCSSKCSDSTKFSPAGCLTCNLNGEACTKCDEAAKFILGKAGACISTDCSGKAPAGPDKHGWYFNTSTEACAECITDCGKCYDSLSCAECTTINPNTQNTSDPIQCSKGEYKDYTNGWSGQCLKCAKNGQNEGCSSCKTDSTDPVGSVAFSDLSRPSSSAWDASPAGRSRPARPVRVAPARRIRPINARFRTRRRRASSK